MRQGRAENEVLIASIFVNPTQFGPYEDLGNYPRDLSRDLKLLESLGVDVVFVPTADEIYGIGTLGRHAGVSSGAGTSGITPNWAFSGPGLSSTRSALPESAMDEFATAEEAATYRMLKQVLQNHVTLQEMSILAASMACTGLLGDHCLECCTAGTAPLEVVADMLGWLKRGVRNRHQRARERTSRLALQHAADPQLGRPSAAPPQADADPS